MKYDDICSVVVQRAAVERPEADRVLKATLQALSEQADREAFERVRVELPNELASSPEPPDRAQRRHLEGFLTRVATLADRPVAQVRRPVLAALAALSAAVPPGVLQSAVVPLGEDIAALLPPPDELLDTDVFLDRVRRRAGVPTRAEAESAAHATLDALAARVSAGQARDLAPYLPPPLRPHLDHAPAEAQPFGYAEFLGRVAEQRATAETHARAVLATLREAAPEPEIQDSLAQLPDDLTRLFV